MKNVYGAKHSVNSGDYYESSCYFFNIHIVYVIQHFSEDHHLEQIARIKVQIINIFLETGSY